MKRYILKKGDVLEVPLPEKGVGYVRVIGKDEFGMMFEIYGNKFGGPVDEETYDLTTLAVKAVAYINPHGAKSNWQLRFRNKPGVEQMPQSFYGSPDRWWFVREGKPIKKISQWFDDGATVRKIDPREVSYDEMIATGYVHKALWLPISIERLLCFEEPLKWKWR